MKTINAKRIAAVAASLLMGLAFAGSGGVTWSNIPIISNAGQPSVQVVIGSTAQPSDGVVAANIAAVIGNLAFTSVNVTATAGNAAGVHCVVTTPTCSLTNQQVWFNARGFAAPSGSYAFTALIGSVLNGAVQLGSPSNTKALSSQTAYTYAEGAALQTSPVESPFSAYGSVPTNQTATGLNSGGWKATTFTTGGQDNILEVTAGQLPTLLNNFGGAGESEVLWLTGFPVFNQQTGTNNPQNFDTLSAGGAYQIAFNKPIAEPFIAKGNSINNAAITFLGKNWTILNYTTPSSSVTTTTVVHQSGTKLSLAATLTPISTVYVGHNVSSGGFTVALTDLGQPNSNGVSQASVNVYYNGTLTNTTQLSTATTTKFQTGVHSIYVKVNQTFAGLYAYQKWAKIQLYSNVLNITDSQALNNTNAKGWDAYVLWTNGTSTGRANMLQGIVIVNLTPVTIGPGGSYAFVTPNMTRYKVQFAGDTLGQNIDPVTFQLQSTSSSGAYQNLGTQHAAAAGSATITNITNEPAQWLTVTSKIPNAFTYSGQTGSSITYDLTPYQLNEVNTASNVIGGASTSVPLNVVVISTVGDANIINSNSAYTVTVKGYTSTGQNAQGIAQITSFAGGNAIATVVGSTNFFNVTSIYANRALPFISIYAVTSPTNTVASALAANTLASLTTGGPTFEYQLANQNYQAMTAVSSNAATYNQQNGQPSVNGGFQITPASTPSPVTAKSNPYFTFNIVEYNVPGSTSFTDNVIFGIYNASANGAQNFAFQLNQSASGTKNNITYTSSQGNSVTVPAGFVTERGSKFTSESASSLTIAMAKTVDTLQYVVGPITALVGSNTVTTASIGPVGVGQAVPGYANLTVSKVNASCAFTSTSCSVAGLSNLTATPSVTHAVVPVSLNTATAPIAVLDSQASSTAQLILVGSKYVNSVSAQVFAQNPSLNSSFGPGSVVVSAEGTNKILVAGYSAADTVNAGNQFINDLLQAAGSP